MFGNIQFVETNKKNNYSDLVEVLMNKFETPK